MKTTHSWHSTRMGAAACWLGSIQFAVPILALVAVGLAVGTYLESTRDAKMARAVVYGAPWFMVLMGLMCLSLIFAVVVRYPWKRKHAGFIVVHASLVMLIAGGFWSMLGRVEGRLVLTEGRDSKMIELPNEQLMLVEHDAGDFKTIASIPAPTRPGRAVIGGLAVDVTDVWDNVNEEFEITDDGPVAYRAIQIQFGPVAESAMWIGDETQGGPGNVNGLKIRVLAAGKDWQPPASVAPGAPPAAGQTSYTFAVNDATYPLASEGQEAFPGWKISSIRRFSHATVAAGEMTETSSDNDNPAVEVVITDGKGTSERHAAFEKFPDMILAKTIGGAAKSGARLTPPAKGTTPAAIGETLVIYGDPPAIKAAYVAPDGTAKTLEHDGTMPWTADFGARKFLILKQFTRAQEHSFFTKAPTAVDRRPALVVTAAGVAEPLAWKGPPSVVNVGGRMLMLRFGPGTVTLPFSLRLDQFRKTDYPGTEMAMAYESDVTVNGTNLADRRQTISMNNPLVQSGWKVYQSGFEGDKISIFSVMTDPGLTLTYIGAAALCLGILITFYGRGLSWGHPGIPTPFSAVSSKEQSNAPLVVVHDSFGAAAGSGNGRSLVGASALDAEAGIDGNPGRRPSDAAGHVRA